MAKKSEAKTQKSTVLTELLARPTCGSCTHFERFPDPSQKPGKDITGECVLNPPTVIDRDEDGNVLQASPIKSARERCGQHRPTVH